MSNKGKWLLAFFIKISPCLTFCHTLLLSFLHTRGKCRDSNNYQQACMLPLLQLIFLKSTEAVCSLWRFSGSLRHQRSLLIDHEITLKISEFVINSIEKVKPGFLLNVSVSWIERDKILISQLPTSKYRYFADQNGPKAGSHENEFWNATFKCKHEFPKQLGLEKQMKKWGRLSGFHVSFLNCGS